jgi:hypothetical protein
MAANAVNQREAAAFLVAYAGDVLGGHADVGRPGRQGDPDTASDASDQ